MARYLLGRIFPFIYYIFYHISYSKNYYNSTTFQTKSMTSIKVPVFIFGNGFLNLNPCRILGKDFQHVRGHTEVIILIQDLRLAKTPHFHKVLGHVDLEDWVLQEGLTTGHLLAVSAHFLASA